MRERWPRFRPELSLSDEAVAHLLHRALPGAVVLGHAPVGGGLANTNLRVALAGRPARVLLRLYQRDPAQAPKEAWLDTVLQSHGVPTARFHRLIEADPVTGLTASVLDWVDGTRLDQWAPGPDDRALGLAVGRVLARVHFTPVGPPGFLTPDRRPIAAITLSRVGLSAYLHHFLITGPGAARLGATRTVALLAFVERYADGLDAWNTTPGLVHGDCNASNFIMTDGPTVAALLDWEFAFSGAPAFDFGHLLRPPLGARQAFVDGLARGYRKEGGVLPPGWRWLARLTDLYAWVDFLGRPTVAAPLIEDACRMVEETLALTPAHLPDS